MCVLGGVMVLNCFTLFPVFNPSLITDDLNQFSSWANYLSTFNVFNHLIQERINVSEATFNIRN